MRAPLVFAALFLSPSQALARVPADLGGVLTSACVSGAHTNRHGACLPDVVQVDRYCPAGTTYAPKREGWSCEPFSLDVQ